MRQYRRATILILLASAVGQAQRSAVTVRVRVIDTTGIPIANANVVALHGLNDVVATGTTDAAGLSRFTMHGDDEYEIQVRHFGFQRGDQFVRTQHDSLALTIRLQATPAQMPVVEVTAQQDLRYKRYHVGADDIEASTRPINDALDVVTKLRPDMMKPPGEGLSINGRALAPCGLNYIWINGKRIVFQPVDPGIEAKARQQIHGAHWVQIPGRPANVPAQARVPVTVQSVLAKIRPEHIAEMNYVDCRDNTLDFARSQGAVFVTLKTGVGFDMLTGTFVLDASDVSPAYRRRVLGLFDAQTGEAIVGAQIVDAATGTFAITTATGTASLAFLPDGKSTLQLRKPGYAEAKLEVFISPSDTAWITLLLKRAK